MLAGSLSGVSILQTPRALPEPEALHVLQQAIGRIDAPVLVHCCASDVPWGLLRRSGAAMVGFDVDTLGTSDLDGIGELLDGGVDLALGLVPTGEPERTPGWRELAEPATRLFDRLGFPRELLSSRVAVTPACGLAGASLDRARAALRSANDVTRAFADGADPDRTR